MNKKLAFAAVFATAAGLIFAGVAPAQATSSVTVTAPITTGGDYGAVAVSNDASLVAVVSEYDGATIYNLAADTQVDVSTTTLNDSGDLGYPAFSPDNTLLYVADYDNDTVIVVDVSTGTVSRTIAGFSRPWAVTASQDGDSLYVHGYSDGNVYKVDLSNSDTVTGPINDLGSYANTMCISADGATLYSPSYGNDTLAVINTADMSITAQWDTGIDSEPYSCTTDNDRNLIVGLHGTGAVMKFAPDGSSTASAVDATPGTYGAAASCDTIYSGDYNTGGLIEALELSTLVAKTTLIPAEAPDGEGFYGYSAARSLDGSVVALGGYYGTDGLVIIQSPECADAAATPIAEPTLAQTGVNGTNTGLMAGGAAVFALLGAGIFIAFRRRAARN
jgi:LPXTG-motif cell wall-anchored protein